MSFRGVMGFFFSGLLYSTQKHATKYVFWESMPCMVYYYKIHKELIISGERCYRNLPFLSKLARKYLLREPLMVRGYK